MCIAWVRFVSCRVVSCRVVSCRVVSCRVVSCRVVSFRSAFVLVGVWWLTRLHVPAVSYVDQSDIHLPLLTVKETFEFAYHAWNGDHRDGFNDVMMVGDSMRVPNVLKLLGLAHCQDTIVGDALNRGVCTFAELSPCA